MSINDPTGRLMRCRLWLSQFEFIIVHRSGRNHQITDALSHLRREKDLQYPSEDDVDDPIVDEDIEVDAIDLY